MPPLPTLGCIVLYRSRTGDYDVPAIVTATLATLNRKGVPDLSSDEHVHLTVFTPGKPALGPNNARNLTELPEGATSQNLAGCYQEWDIGPSCTGEEVLPGTWRWPEHTLALYRLLDSIAGAEVEQAIGGFPPPDRDDHCLVVHDENGHIFGVCRTREAAERLVNEHSQGPRPVTLAVYGFVEDSPPHRSANFGSVEASR